MKMKLKLLIEELKIVYDREGDIEVCYRADPYHSNDFYTPIQQYEIVEDPSPHVNGKRSGRNKVGKDITPDYLKKGRILNLI